MCRCEDERSVFFMWGWGADMGFYNLKIYFYSFRQKQNPLALQRPLVQLL